MNPAEETPLRMDRLGRIPNYDKSPVVAGAGECLVGWDKIAAQIRSADARRVIIESYTGVRREDLRKLAEMLGAGRIVDSAGVFLPEQQIDEIVAPDVTDDPVFGFITRLEIDALLDPGLVADLREEISKEPGSVVVYGTGASLLCDEGLLVYADMPRWEEQLRQRRKEVANLGSSNFEERPGLKYKRSFFVDWRICDRLKRKLWGRMDYVLDTTDRSSPKVIKAPDMFNALSRAARRPFRVVPFFDPAPWGGQWMKEVCDLDRDVGNFGWCFDCVPEENSLLLGFGENRFEIPSINLVFREPKALLGEAVYGRFGDEFPIRFDFLDTMDGGNLSLQVHPLTQYIQEQFGMHYTQDESYYLLDAGEDASVYLGVQEGIDGAAMIEDLYRAEAGEFRFPDEKYINRFPARRHDHFLIPAGTIHCSGANSLVLEISATPFIFTFKLWDWDRLGLDGRPRPLHVDHGANSIQWDRDNSYAKSRLINRIETVAEGDGWVEERTGLHEAEFIETRRHWFTGSTPHDGGDGVNVLNLVSGEEAVVTSPDQAFEPMVVHYAETFIVPAAAGPYRVTPHGRGSGTRCATIKASVRGVRGE